VTEADPENRMTTGFQGEVYVNDHRTIQINDSTFGVEVLQSERPVLVDFWAPWCGPCRALGPTIEELARAYGETAKVGKIDVDANPDAASTYRITALPSVLLFKGGREIDRIVGLQPRTRYEEALRQAGRTDG
jgi:thioredoxin 1